MALLSKNGYGQVEFNKVTSQVTKDIISKLPASNTINAVEMGMFLVPDYTNGVLTLPAADGAAAYIVNNELKNYEPYKTRKDFRLVPTAGNAHVLAQDMYPRCYKLTVGDIFHTNLLDGFSSNSNVGDLFSVATDGILHAESNIENASLAFQVEKVSTMPDGQLAAKLVCVKANY